MNPRLIGVSGPLEGTVCVLPEGEFTIGRDAANQLREPRLDRILATDSHASQ